jgi:hypothetical protein
MAWPGGRSSLGVDREMVEKLDERDKCNDGDVGLSFGGVLGSFGRALWSFGVAPVSPGGELGLFRVLESFEVVTDMKKPPALLSPDSSLLLPGSELYLAISSRISSGDKIYGVMSSAVSKASLSPSTGRKFGLEVLVVIVERERH